MGRKTCYWSSDQRCAPNITLPKNATIFEVPQPGVISWVRISIALCSHDAFIHRFFPLLSWLRHCATNRKVAGPIPDGVTGIFQWLNPSGRTMALGWTQPLTEMSTRKHSWGYRRPVRRADNLTTFMCRLSRNSGASTSRNTKSLSKPVAGKLYLYHYV